MMKKPLLSPKVKSALSWILWTLVFQLVLINISAAIYAYRCSRVYDDGGYWGEKSQGNIFSKTWYLFRGPRFGKTILFDQPTFPYDTVRFKTSGGIDIEAWYSVTDSANAKGTVLLFHGARSNKGLVIPEASEFRTQGYNVLMVDFRSCGNSGGHVTTMGHYEAEEVKLAFDYIKQKGEKNIYCWGKSMGAVAIARAISKNEINPRAVILEKPYLSLKTFLKSRARSYKMPESAQGSFAFLLTFWIGVERGFNGFSQSTTGYVKDIHCPVLLQWGKKDDDVEEFETKEIFNAIPGTNKKLVVYENGGNESLLNNDPGLWRGEVEGFLGRN